MDNYLLALTITNTLAIVFIIWWVERFTYNQGKLNEIQKMYNETTFAALEDLNYNIDEYYNYGEVVD